MNDRDIGNVTGSEVSLNGSPVFAISTAPLVLGGGKRLFEGFVQDIDLEVLGTWSSQYATHVRYAVRQAGQENAAH